MQAEGDGGRRWTEGSDRLGLGSIVDTDHCHCKLWSPRRKYFLSYMRSMNITSVPQMSIKPSYLKLTVIHENQTCTYILVIKLAY